jgi:hypothetical protein
MHVLRYFSTLDTPGLTSYQYPNPNPGLAPIFVEITCRATGPVGRSVHGAGSIGCGRRKPARFPAKPLVLSGGLGG